MYSDETPKWDKTSAGTQVQHAGHRLSVRSLTIISEIKSALWIEETDATGLQV